jgi:hypothetical protein
MGLDPFSSASLITLLDPHVPFINADCPPEINEEIKERVWRVHGKLIHLLFDPTSHTNAEHCVSVLGRWVHNPSQKHLDTYLRVARYLIKPKDL